MILYFFIRVNFSIAIEEHDIFKAQTEVLLQLHS